ncbi:MAG: glycosyltransferase [Bacteroidia bacterium]|nr:glycosyltransferase [Bacteroidia bacterium]NNF31524.1 glycosyltransferase [Flavobacteriaceae bacterium]MBT8275599.1 glycosyltransferase [Bacteroidia bacterium]NNJ82789.1 glycosyltransferase [Flavobacteriaceae bacterium]NNK54103.1 glycosyltransferase [Flavobacteriaceae bacterium]
MQLKETKEHTNDKSSPLISIITPLYNAESFVSETIKSVLNQTYSNWEQIIVNDASTDASLSIVKRFAQNDERIRIEDLSNNKGAAYCRNLATDLARGTYIAFLDSDDLWHTEKLEKQVAFMIKNKCDVSYTSYLHIDESGNSLNKRILALPKLSYKKQHCNNYIGNLTGMYNAEILGKIASPDIRKRQDWAVWLEAIKRSGKPALGLQEDLSLYRVRRDSMSSNKAKLVKYNYSFYKDYLGYSSIKSGWNLMKFFYEYFFVRPRYIQKL